MRRVCVPVVAPAVRVPVSKGKNANQIHNQTDDGNRQEPVGVDRGRVQEALCERERESASVCESERERVCVCVCVYEREREREKERKREHKTHLCSLLEDEEGDEDEEEAVDKPTEHLCAPVPVCV